MKSKCCEKCKGKGSLKDVCIDMFCKVPNCHKPQEQSKCICACHDNLKKPFAHDTKCCEKMNGFIEQSEESWENSEYYTIPFNPMNKIIDVLVQRESGAKERAMAFDMQSFIRQQREQGEQAFQEGKKHERKQMIVELDAEMKEWLQGNAKDSTDLLQSVREQAKKSEKERILGVLENVKIENFDNRVDERVVDFSRKILEDAKRVFLEAIDKIQ